MLRACKHVMLQHGKQQHALPQPDEERHSMRATALPVPTPQVSDASVALNGTLVALVGVAEHSIHALQLLELLVSIISFAFVRMQHQGQLAVCPLDLVLQGSTVDNAPGSMQTVTTHCRLQACMPDLIEYHASDNSSNLCEVS
jgi:hypothetical protein